MRAVRCPSARETGGDVSDDVRVVAERRNRRNKLISYVSAAMCEDESYRWITG